MLDSNGIGRGKVSNADRFLARSVSSGKLGDFETCVEHLEMAGCLSGAFAEEYGDGGEGVLTGLLHDIGKYSCEFQQLIRHPESHARVDHSSAGAFELFKHSLPMAAMAVAGHHAGLANFGSKGDIDGDTFCARMTHSRPNYEAWTSQISPDFPGQNNILESGCRSWFDMMMIGRMLFSGLIDADRLDAEYYTHTAEGKRVARVENAYLDELKQRLGPEMMRQQRARSFDELRAIDRWLSDEVEKRNAEAINRIAEKVEQKAQEYIASEDSTPLNRKRCDILTSCMQMGKRVRASGFELNPDARTVFPHAGELYRLTAPTGSGKTNASISFAAEYAKTHHKSRIIYVIPYMSVIDQTADSFIREFGTDAVLAHYSEASFQLKEEDEMNRQELRESLAAENWDVPIVVTTAVQFFDSLYSNRTSRCRKLHNIANSVLVFDEVQTLPFEHLVPCVQAIAELVLRFSVTAVLCTATQPALQEEFACAIRRLIASKGRPANAPTTDAVTIPEISPLSSEDASAFRRYHLEQAGKIAEEDLAKVLGRHRQVLCVVNKRKTAQDLYRMMADGLASDGRQAGNEVGLYCLTTFECAWDRRRLLQDIRRRLQEGKPCRVVSTSLIEAGVDVDFPCAYREEAGLDSILQTAGRCNREGLRPADDCAVTIFSLDGVAAPAYIRQNVAAFRDVVRNFSDPEELVSQDAIHDYFEYLYRLQGDEAHDAQGIIRLHEEGYRGQAMPFKTIGDTFDLLDTQTSPIYIPLPDSEGEALCQQLEDGDISRSLFRKLGPYSVMVWDRQLVDLVEQGKASAIQGNQTEAVLTDLSCYQPGIGLVIPDHDSSGAKGLFM